MTTTQSTTKYSHGGKTTAWADGFGVWHVSVSRTACAPLIAARRRLYEELTAREGMFTLAPAVWMRPVRTPEHDTTTTIAYREGNTEREH